METADTAGFADLLRRHRLAAGLTQEALAERAGLSARAIRALERGERRAPYRETVTLLARALALGPEGRAALLAAARPDAKPGRPARETSTNLPIQLTSFVGRGRELAEVKRALERTRLLTLTGTGGVGKTRLALQATADLVERYPDGVRLVELAPLADPALVSSAVAGALSVAERPGQPIQQTLVEALRSRRLLLLLDNCEHLLGACAGLAERLLRACPGVRILATSREPLGVEGEAVYRVPSLALSDPAQPADRVAALASEAVQLLAARAALVRPDFAVTADNAAAVVAICRRLDGIPLAIELAAARLRVLSPEQLLARLHDWFRLLVGGHAPLRRQQTLQATLDWSHDLLAEREKALFRRLAVFAGGFPLEAAEAVASGDELLAADVLDLLTRLVDRSLVQTEDAGRATRYRLLETLRTYALNRLDASGEAVAARAAHAAYFAALVGGPSPQPVTNVIELLVTPAGATAVGPAAGEVDNLRAALGWYLDRGEAEAGLGLAARIHHLWFVLGPREEGRAWLRRFLALPSADAAPSRAAALYAAGWLAQFQGDLATAHVAYAEAAALALARGDRRGQAYAQTALGVVALLQGAPARAELEAGIRLSREADATANLLDGLANLGSLAIAQGDLAAARAALAEGRAALARYPVLRFRFHWLAGDLALAEGDGAQAAQEYRAGLADRWAGGDPVGVAASTLGLAEVAAAAGVGARAARLLGGSEGIALAVGDRPIVWPLQRAQHARVEAAARGLLGEDAFAALRAEGRRLGLDEVARLALEEDDNR